MSSHLVSIESTYATSYRRKSNLGPILHRFRNIAGFLLKTAIICHPYAN